MTDKDTAYMISNCIAEIKNLRGEINQLAPKAEAYEMLRQVLNLSAPSKSGGYGPAIVYRLERELHKLQGKAEPEDDVA